jgi:3-deoxy-manno-octulosonate cytidylyltransferase (CMP-KDO synthetase)
MNPIVVIPARMAATRLPDKPLADIGGVSMIVRVLRQAQAAGIGPVAVAAGDIAIVHAVQQAGGQAVLTDPALPSGSDRILAALEVLDPERRHDVVINLQGDMPFVQPSVLSACADLLGAHPGCDIATVVAPEASPADRSNPDVVKAVLAMEQDGLSGRALYFTRSTLYGDAPIWRHIGIYGYRRAALETFIRFRRRGGPGPGGVGAPAAPPPRPPRRAPPARDRRAAARPPPSGRSPLLPIA